MSAVLPMNDIANNIFAIENDADFSAAALQVFAHQYAHNAVYRQWVDLLGVRPAAVQSVEEIPALPIELYKSKRVVAFDEEPVGYFQSSGTTGMVHSHHYFRTLALYERSLMEGFRRFWGDPRQYMIVAVLPNYLKQGHSSLIHMMRVLIEATQSTMGGFYDAVTPDLLQLLRTYRATERRLILFGVTYALLDILEQGTIDLHDAIIFETGGMKGRREEMLKPQLHSLLCEGFHVGAIASEYGMCELFSQAYSYGRGLFLTPPWMKVRIRDLHAPCCMLSPGRTGGIDVIDLANLDSCAFISTQDLGKLHMLPNGPSLQGNKDANTYVPSAFEILGRYDYSDLRGCNLMAEM